jgi:hypothetical protein
MRGLPGFLSGGAVHSVKGMNSPTQHGTGNAAPPRRAIGRRTTAGLLLAGLTATALAAAAGPVAARGSTDSLTTKGYGRGQLVAVQPLRSLATREEVIAELKASEFHPDSVKYTVDMYQLVYRTIDAQGRPTIASGLLALPRNGARELRTVSYTHGTEINRTDTPSMWRDAWAVAPAITYASAGFAAVAPDYLGLGVGPGTHPFQDVPSETTAAVDMLRAARNFVPRTGKVLQRQVMVTGFSQGGAAGIGLARALQGGADDWFRLGALAPIAGVYDWQHVELPALLDGTVPAPWNVGYTAYFVVAWNRLHHLYDHPSEMFTKDYADTVEQLFDGVRTGDDLAKGLPDSVDKLLTSDGLTMLRNPTGRLAAAMRVYDSVCADWAPQVPVRLYVSGGDEQALHANSEHCHVALGAHGVNAPIVDVGTFQHDGSAHLGANILGTAENVRWFSQLQ